MVKKQLSVFIENREGRLETVTGILKDNGINMDTLSLADTTEFGMLRLIADDCEKGRQVLKEAGFSTMLTDVLVIKLEARIGALHDLLHDMGTENMNIEYMYTLPGSDAPYIVMKVAKPKEVSELLEKKGYRD